MRDKKEVALRYRYKGKTGANYKSLKQKNLIIKYLMLCARNQVLSD
jgi:hypothetical protein